MLCWFLKFSKKPTKNLANHKITASYKGQIISKRFFLAEDSSKKQTKTRRILVKTNSFVRFLEESSAWQLAFEINWPLRMVKNSANVVWERPLRQWILFGSSWLVEQFFRRKESLLVSSFLLKDSPYCSAYFQSIIWSGEKLLIQ